MKTKRRRQDYKQVPSHGHPNANARGWISEHRLVAARAYGKPLPSSCQVHHVNEISTDNRPNNLIVCQDASYHSLLHSRKRALTGWGHADWRWCPHCKKWDDPNNLYINGWTVGHSRCRTMYVTLRRKAGLPSGKGNCEREFDEGPDKDEVME